MMALTQDVTIRVMATSPANALALANILSAALSSGQLTAGS